MNYKKLLNESALSYKLLDEKEMRWLELSEKN